MRFFFLVIITCTLFSCSNQNNDEIQNQPIVFDESDASTVLSSFFPVGDFINGQIAEIKKTGINPMIIKKSNSDYDTSWLAIEQFDQTFNTIFLPNIDSIKYSSFFKEKKFFDKTLNAFTFTYDPPSPLPDSIPWRNWIIYIDPENNQVNRVFLVKQLTSHKISQITWIPGKSCSSIIITDDSVVSDEIKIIWNFKK